MWFNNSSFSLALYAFEEKFLFNSEAKDYEKEINDNQELLDENKKIVVKRNNIDEEIKDSKDVFGILGAKVSNIFKYEYSVKEEKYNRNII